MNTVFFHPEVAKLLKLFRRLYRQDHGVPQARVANVEKFQPLQHMLTLPSLQASRFDFLKYERYNVNSFYYGHGRPLIECFNFRLGIGIFSGTLVYRFVAGYVHTTGHIKK